MRRTPAYGMVSHLARLGRVHPYQRFSSWVLVVLGAVLIVSGLVGLVDAVVHHQWGAAVFTLVLLVVICLGTARGVRQLRRREPPSA